MKKRVVLLVFFGLMILSGPSFAQCSMCTANAENGMKNGNTQTKGINSGVMYLMSFPFLMLGGAALLWYSKFRTPKP